MANFLENHEVTVLIERLRGIESNEQNGFAKSSVGDVKDLFNAPIAEFPLILDLRPAEDYLKGHVQGALSFPLPKDCEAKHIEEFVLRCFFETFYDSAPQFICTTPLIIGSNGGYPDDCRTIFVIAAPDQFQTSSLSTVLSLLSRQGIPSFMEKDEREDQGKEDSPSIIQEKEDREVDPLTVWRKDWTVEWSEVNEIKLLSDDDGSEKLAELFPFLITRGNHMRYGSDTIYGRSIALSDWFSHHQGKVDTPLSPVVIEKEPSLFFPQMIEDWGLYLGSNHHASDRRVLSALNISCVINLTRECANHFEGEEEGDSSLRLEYHRFPADDVIGQKMVDYWQQGYEILESCSQSGRKCLVHCAAGKSRSASLIVFYLMKSKKWILEEAMNYTKKCRSRVAINPGFLRQLNEEIDHLLL